LHSWGYFRLIQKKTKTFSRYKLSKPQRIDDPWISNYLAIGEAQRLLESELL